ncbi:GTPase IMAP family member 7-like [Cebidichthys violaceus]|uniref:GTPase IMAP family member 7-like n=1 Tax=Cebidichthys violaceus TaxID=271503 RepID=UPI0035CA6782
MSHKKTIVVLGSEAALKKGLIFNIIENDEVKTRVLKETEIYENNTYRFICPPDLNKRSKDIKEVFAICYPDLSLLVVKEGFSTNEVWKQIEQLHKLTGKPTEEFTVVLPLNHERSESYPFRSFTMSELFNYMSRTTEEKGKPSDTRVNLVLLGMSGTGKSASGNTILREDIFRSKASSCPVTTECQVMDLEIDGRRVRVIDTPDIFDDTNETTNEKHVNKCRYLSEDGSTVYLLVIHVSRFTDGERNILWKLEKAFGSKAYEKTLILFTREADLKQGQMTEEDFMRSFTPDLNTIVTKCGNRCVMFENKDSRSDQVERLMQAVHQMLG